MYVFENDVQCCSGDLSVFVKSLSQLLLFLKHLLSFERAVVFDSLEGMSLTRAQVQRATTISPWTRDFRHLLPVPRHFQNRQTWFDPVTKAVRVKDRIKFWNVVPGDQISIRGDARKTIHEVLSINKFTNRVYLKGANLVRGLLCSTSILQC